MSVFTYQDFGFEGQSMSMDNKQTVYAVYVDNVRVGGISFVISPEITDSDLARELKKIAGMISSPLPTSAFMYIYCNEDGFQAILEHSPARLEVA